MIVLYLFAFTWIYALIKYQKMLRNELSTKKHLLAEINNFLETFSKTLQTSKEIDDAMKRTADYVADLIGAKALCILTVSDSLVTGEATTSQERQESFTDMMTIALEAAIEF